MKALILAAGFGKRLQPLTNTIPKAMAEVNGKPLLENALNCLKSTHEISEIGIVVGHMAGYIKEHIGNSWDSIPIRYFENERYLTTNNVVSVYEARDFFDDEIVMLECDLFYKPSLIHTFLEKKADCMILVSPFDADTMDGTVIKTSGDRAEELILGVWQGEDFDYSSMRKTVNIYHFSKEFSRKFITLIQWYVENIGENSYYEKVLGMILFLREDEIRVCEVPSHAWCEIDDLNDLERAKALFEF